jgi:colanic acid/amylovoran biosynthesis protein
MKIALTGITSLRNHGVEALVVTLIHQLRQRFPNPTFLVLDRAPEYDASRLTDPGINCLYDETSRPLYASRIRSAMLQGSGWVKGLAPEFQQVREEISSSDLVCATGGDLFASEYGHRSLLSHLAPLRTAREFNKPFFFVAQSIGPFKSDEDREAFVEVARDAAGISVRESQSFDYVTQQLGLPDGLVTLTADPAFLLKPEGPQPLSRFRAHFNFAPDQPVVAVTPSQAICNWMNSDYDRHFQVWCSVIDLIRRELNAAVLIVPHVQETAPRNDDRVLATAILRHFAFDPLIQIAGADFSAGEFKGMISQCDMVVSERMHSCIAGLSSAVCTVAIGYSIKAKGIIGDLFPPEMVQNGLLLPVQDFLDENIARSKVREAWARRQAVHEHLVKVLPETRRRAELTFDLIARKMGIPG